MCPKRTDTERGDRICCPFLGKVKLGQAVEVAGGGGAIRSGYAELCFFLCYKAMHLSFDGAVPT